MVLLVLVWVLVEEFDFKLPQQRRLVDERKQDGFLVVVT